MKKININFYAFVLSIAILLSSCAGLDKMKEQATGIKYTVNPTVLEMHAGEVKASINGEFPAKFFNKNAILVITPIIKYDGGELALEQLTLQGEAVQENYKVIPYDAGGNFTHNISFEFKDEMKVSQLVLKLEAKLKDKTLPFADAKIADGIITTPNLVRMAPKAILMPDAFKRVVPQNKEADILYVISKADVRNSELKQEDIKALKALIKAAKESDRMTFKKAKISAFASPDGPEDFNDKLSIKRKESADKFISQQLKGQPETQSFSFYEKKATAEDWDGFKKLMEESDIKDKELILRVLSMYTDPVVREKEIKNISAAYLDIADEVLPKLRRSVLSVEVNKTGYSDDELLELAKSNPDTLNIEEMLYVANLITDDYKKLDIYTAAAKKYPKCIRARNNAGVTNVELKQISQAKENLDSAKAIKENAIVDNNLGAVALLEGDMETAKELLLKATDAGKDVGYNLGIISIKNGDYEAAVNYLAQTNSFNQALAMLLAGNSNAALNTLDQIEEPDAFSYYLKAVIGARMHDQNLTMNNLRTAVGKNEHLKEYVKTDMEFARYFEDETFKTIIQ